MRLKRGVGGRGMLTCRRLALSIFKLFSHLNFSIHVPIKTNGKNINLKLVLHFLRWANFNETRKTAGCIASSLRGFNSLIAESQVPSPHSPTLGAGERFWSVWSHQKWNWHVRCQMHATKAGGSRVPLPHCLDISFYFFFFFVFFSPELHDPSTTPDHVVLS